MNLVAEENLPPLALLSPLAFRYAGGGNDGFCSGSVRLRPAGKRDLRVSRLDRRGRLGEKVARYRGFDCLGGFLR